jgi:oligopeptide transport system substrate-binding protein
MSKGGIFMLKNKMAKLSVLALTVVLVGSMFAGCSSQPAATKDPQKVSYNLGADPQTIDPGLNSSVEGGTVIVNAFEGLVDIDANEKPVPGVAKSWTISPDGLTYTFTLRKDAKWSDGKGVTAKDFEYAWKRALDPATASDYAYQLYYLKNAQGYNESAAPAKDKTPGVAPATKDQVGVQAVDDYTLKVTLASPTPYFLSLTAFPTYMPLRQDVVEKDPKGWATKASTYISNGAFNMTDWKLKATMTFTKNPNYWNKANIKLDSITYYMLDQETSATAAFTTGQVDINDLIPVAQKPSLIANGTAKNYPYLGTYYYDINCGDKATANSAAVTKALKDVRVREALNLAIDKQALVTNVTKGGEIAATSYVPTGIKDNNGKDFKNKDYMPATGDVAKAQQLLKDAGYPGGVGFPTIEILYNTSQNHQNIAAAVQDMWKKNLGINVTLRNVERKVQLADGQTEQFQILRNGWIADYADPMTFLDMWETGNGQNYSGYSNPAYDKLIQAAKAETDAAKRMTDMHEAEAILMTDFPVIPLYYYTNVVEIKSYVKDLHKSPLGFVYFQNTYIDKSTK